jgi:hypothetical protein
LLTRKDGVIRERLVHDAATRCGQQPEEATKVSRRSIRFFVLKDAIELHVARTR